MPLRRDALTGAAQCILATESLARSQPPLMLVISVREAIRDAVRSFEPQTDFILPSPCTGEAVKSLIRK